MELVLTASLDTHSWYCLKVVIQQNQKEQTSLIQSTIIGEKNNNSSLWNGNFVKFFRINIDVFSYDCFLNQISVLFSILLQQWTILSKTSLLIICSTYLCILKIFLFFTPFFLLNFVCFFSCFADPLFYGLRQIEGIKIWHFIHSNGGFVKFSELLLLCFPMNAFLIKMVSYFNFIASK